MTTDERTTSEPAARHGGTDGTYEQDVPGFGTVRIRVLDPAGDADVVHRWVTEERARFWGMTGHTRQQVQDIYGFVDSLTTHHAYLAFHDDLPAALFQTYQPEHDPLGEHYDVQDGDLGIHLLIAPSPAGRRHGYTGALIGAFLSFVLTDPSVRRIVAEPDIRNDKSIARLLRSGFEPGPQVDLDHKRAQLVFLTRDSAEKTLRSAPA
ncbi:GNAT family N-acetyltransferase [Streptomyces sp. NPDC052051]|uniref:GNAT family N-acetyltransferase n=1 Tax=Streptomyces sp. NPDC052051 TaxID=3154649 RepID=UPI00342F6E69